MSQIFVQSLMVILSATPPTPATDDDWLTAVRMEQLIAELGDSDRSVRRQAAFALGRLGPAAKPAVAALLLSTRDPAFSVRSDAVEALGKIGPEAKAAVGRLIELLDDPEPEIRMRATASLRRIGPGDDAVGKFIEPLADPTADVEVHLAAVRRLAAFGTAAALPRLCFALAHYDVRVRREVPRALAAMGPAGAQAYKNLVAATQTDPDARVRQAAYEAAGVMEAQIPAVAVVSERSPSGPEMPEHRPKYVKADTQPAVGVPIIGQPDDPSVDAWTAPALIVANCLLLLVIAFRIRRRLAESNRQDDIRQT